MPAVETELLREDETLPWRRSSCVLDNHSGLCTLASLNNPIHAKALIHLQSRQSVTGFGPPFSINDHENEMLKLDGGQYALPDQRQPFNQAFRGIDTPGLLGTPRHLHGKKRCAEKILSFQKVQATTTSIKSRSYGNRKLDNMGRLIFASSFFVWEL